MNAFARLIPETVLRRVANRPAFLNEVSHYITMEDDQLLRATESCLRNLVRFNEVGADENLQCVLVPELWERMRPGVRDKLRRLSTTLAEYNPDPNHPSIFARKLSPETLVRLSAEAHDLRQRIEQAAILDDQALVEQVRFAIAGSRAGDRWAPEDFVYEPGFVYRVVPAIAWRLLDRQPRKVTA